MEAQEQANQLKVDQPAVREEALAIYKREAIALVEPAVVAEITQSVDALVALPSISQEQADALGILVGNIDGHIKRIDGFWKDPKSGADLFHKMIVAANKDTTAIWHGIRAKAAAKVKEFFDKEAEQKRKAALATDSAIAASVNELAAQRDQLMRSGDIEAAQGLDSRVTALASAPAMQSAGRPVVKGMSLTETWVGDVTNMKMFLAAISTGAIPMEWDGKPLIEVNQAVLNRAASAQRLNLNWPGVEAKAETGIRRNSKGGE